MQSLGSRLFFLVWAFWLSQNFVDGTTATSSGCVGGGAADVVFLLDSSYSVWRPDFRRQLTFVQEVIDRLPIGPNNVRVAIVTYADYPQLQFHLHHYFVKPDLRAAVDGIRQRGGFQTITGDAIRFLRRNVFEVGSRSRPLGVSVAQVAVVITDGRSDNRTATDIEAELAKQEGVLVFVVGVGKNVDVDEVQGIGSLPSDYYTFLVDSFAGLARIRDLVATKACKVAESVRRTSTTAARLAYNNTVMTEASFNKAPIIKEMATKPASNNNASFTRSVFTEVLPEDVASTKTAYFKTTLTKLVSAGLDSIASTAIAASHSRRAPYTESTFARPTLARIGLSRAASTTAVSAAAVASPVATTATYYATSASTTKLFSQTFILQQENVSLAPSTGIAGAQRSRKIEDLQPPMKGDGSTKLPIAVAISDGGVQTETSETVTSQEPPNGLPTYTSEGSSVLRPTSGGFRASEDSTDNPHKIASNPEIGCGLDKMLTEKNNSAASKKDGETEDETEGTEEQQRPTTVWSNAGASGTELQQIDSALSSFKNRNTTSTPVILAQVTDGLNSTGMKKTFETISTTTASRTHVADGSVINKSRIKDDIQRSKVVLTNGDDKWGSDEPRVLPSGKGTGDEKDSGRGRSRQGNGRLNNESGYQVKDYWRLNERGRLVRYRMVSPDVNEREDMASDRAPRHESNTRRIGFQRFRATHSSAVDDSRTLDSNHFNEEMTVKESRGNVSYEARSGHTTSSPRLISKTKGRRGGFTRGSEMQGINRYGPYAAFDRRNHELTRHHRPPEDTNGYWRLNNLGKLVWQNNSLLPSRNHTWDNLNMNAPDVYTLKTLNTGSFRYNPDYPHTQSHLGEEEYRFDSKSDPHPRINAANSMTPSASPGDVTESFSKQETTRTAEEQRRSTRTPVPSSPGIDSHPRKGFWKYDRYGRHGVWVSYTHNNDRVSTGATTEAPAMTFANVNPTFGTKGPSLVDSHELSYGYWKREKGKRVWYEYQSPGIYRKVNDMDPLAVPTKIRIELPSGMVPGCRGCNRTRSPLWYGHGKINQSDSAEEMVVFRARDRVEKLVLNQTRPLTLDDETIRYLWQALANIKQRVSDGLSENSSSSQFNTSAKSRIEGISTLLDRFQKKVSVVRHYNRSFLSSSDHGFNKISFQSSPLDSIVGEINGTGNSKRNWTYENVKSVWSRGFKEMDGDRGRSHRTSIATELQHGLEENHVTNSILTTVIPRRDGTIWSAKATRSVLSHSPPRRQLEPRHRIRVGVTASVHRKESSAPTKSNRKHARGCVVRRPLEAVFVVDPRARKEPYTKQLWQLAYEVVFQVHMDDDRVRVRFYPELEEVQSASNGSAASGSVQTVMQKVAQKPVPELLRMTSRLLSKAKKGVRRIGIYLTDGPSGTPLELDRAAKEVKTDAAAAAGLELFVVGIGQETDPAELETIVDPSLKGKHLYRITKPLKSNIDAVAMKLTRALCGGR